MKFFTPRPAPSSQSGFTLLEILLVVAISAVLFVGIMGLTRDWANSQAANSAGQHLQRVTTAVQGYVEANWANLAETTDAVNGGAAGWGELRNKLNQEGLLTNGALQSPMGTPLQISYVRTGGESRAVIFGTQTLPYPRVIEAARQSGSYGGTRSTFPDANTAVGAFGQWRVAANQLFPGGNFPCVPNGNDACLVSVVTYDDTVLCGMYLYRNATGCIGGNSMSTNLDMQDNNITNARDINTVTMTASDQATTGNLTVNGTSLLNGQTTMNSGLDVTGGPVNVNGDASFSNNVQMTGNANLRVLTLDANTVETDRIETTNLQAENMSVNGAMVVDQDVTMNGNLTVNGTGEILAGTLNAGQINANNGSIQVKTAEVQNSMNITGDVKITNGVVSTEQLTITKCTKIDVNGVTKPYGNCP